MRSTLAHAYTDTLDNHAAPRYTIPMRIKIDEEWEHNGVTYWLQAEADITLRESIERSEYWGSVDYHTYTEVQAVDVRSWRVLGYDAVAQGYETVLEEPRLLQAAKAWVKEHGDSYLEDA